MKHKFENKTENTLEKDDRVNFHFNHFDREVGIAFHSNNDVSSYLMPLDKFINSLQTSIEDFDKTELEVMKMIATVLFGQIKKIESKTEQEVTI